MDLNLRSLAVFYSFIYSLYPFVRWYTRKWSSGIKMQASSKRLAVCQTPWSVTLFVLSWNANEDDSSNKLRMKSEQLTCRQPWELDSRSKKLDISTEAKNTRNSCAELYNGSASFLYLLHLLIRLLLSNVSSFLLKIITWISLNNLFIKSSLPTSEESYK